VQDTSHRERTQYKEGTSFGVWFGGFAQSLQKEAPLNGCKSIFVLLDSTKKAFRLRETWYRAKDRVHWNCVDANESHREFSVIDGARYYRLHVLKSNRGPPGCTTCWKPHVTELVVCDPRKNASMREATRVTRSYRRAAVASCSLRLNHAHPVLSRGSRLRSLK